MRVNVVVLCCVSLLATPISQSKISVVDVDELIRSTDQIVIATVTQVVDSKVGSFPVKYATATVHKTLKGRSLPNIRFIVVPGNDHFMDSADEAIMGEFVLLFLYKQGDDDFGIKLAGRGRMPLRKVGATTYATLWNDVVLPANAPVIPGPDGRYSFIISVELAYLERRVALQAKECSIVRPNYRIERTRESSSAK